MRRLGAVALAVASLAAACGDDSDSGAPDTTPTTATSTSTTSDTTTTTEPGSVSAPGLVMASPQGVRIVSGPGQATVVSTTPAAAAFAVGTNQVVFQDAETSGGAFPPGAAGPVRAWTGGEIRDLPASPEARRVFLLDAATVDGAPLALVAERFGEVGPDDTFEELVQIDLRDDTRTTIVRRAAWESGHFAARFLPDGDVIGLFASEASILLGRWSATREDALWTTEVGIDIHVDLALRDGEITLIEPAFDSARDFTPVLTISTRDKTTGAEQASDSIDVDDPDGEIDTGLFCRDWTSPTTLACGHAGGEPVIVSVEDGSFDVLPGDPSSIPTVVRPP